MLGLEDGERLDFSTLLSLVRLIRQSVSLPLSIDVERGYASSDGELEQNIAQLIALGVCGINLEDGLPDGTMRDMDAQCRRIAAARRAADQQGVRLFINARTDAFFMLGETQEALNLAVERSSAYADAGADGALLPGMTSPQLIDQACRRIAVPVNVMVGVGEQDALRRAGLGVARISLGPAAFLQAKPLLADVINSALELEALPRS